MRLPSAHERAFLRLAQRMDLDLDRNPEEIAGDVWRGRLDFGQAERAGWRTAETILQLAENGVTVEFRTTPRSMPRAPVNRHGIPVAGGRR